MTSRQPERPTALDVVGALRLESSDGVRLALCGRGADVDVVFPSVRALLAAWRSLPLRRQRARLAHGVQRFFRRADCRFRVLIGQHEIIVLSSVSGGSRLAAVVGIAPARLRLGGLLRALVA